MRLVDKDKLLEELIEGQKAGLGLIWGSKYANINSIDDAIETVDYADEIDLKEHDAEIRADERTRMLSTYDVESIEELIQNVRAKAIEEMAQIIRKIEADTSHCLFDCPKADEPITCTICVLERAVEQMKRDKE